MGLGLFFTGRVSLRTWAETGSLRREVELYARLEPHLRAVTFVTYGGVRDHAYAEELRGVRLVATTWRPWRRWTEWELLRGHGRTLADVDIVKTNQVPGAEIAIAVKRRLAKKLVVRSGYPYSRNVEYEGARAATVRAAVALEREAFAAADAIVMTSERNRAWAIERHGLDPGRVHVVPNYVDTDVFRPGPAASKTYDVAYVGRAGREKNIPWIVAAARRFAERGERLRVLLIGGAAGDRALRRQAEGLDVTFAGNLPNHAIPDYLDRSRLFVLASRYEGHPKALLEAMGCGMPCIGTDVVGIRDEIEHLVTGYLCKPDPDSLTDAIGALLGDEALQRRLGAGGRRWVEERYAIDRVLERELAVLREVVRS